MAPSGSRNGAKVIWICVHTAEGIRDADDLKAFFDRSTNSSSHAVADDTELIENCVPYDRAAWTLRNGNEESDNLELCGFASWSRAEWLNNHQGMLNQAALWIRRRCNARGVPIVKLSAADVRARKAGVIGHVDYTNGTGDGTHWDPGPGFPWDVVIARAKGTEKDMELTDTVDWQKVNDAGPTKLGWSLMNTRDNAKVARENSAAAVGLLKSLAQDIDDAEARILGAVSTSGGAAVDVTVLADALAGKLGPDLGRELVEALVSALAN
jgi:hypothetical protein